MKNTWKRRGLSLLLALVMLSGVTVLGIGDNTERILYTVDGKDYLLQTGTVGVWANLSTKQGTSEYYYSDGYFADDATDYDVHLAAMSAVLMGAANYDGYSANVDSFLRELGYGNLQANQEYINGTTTKSSIGYMLSTKAMTCADGTPTGKTIVAVTIRGANYKKEWASNLLLGESGEAEGFSTSASTVMGALENYIEGMNIGDLVFWVVGQSRAAAVANLVAQRLVDSAYGDDTNVFCYSTGTPMAGLDNGREYHSIHNIVNYNDPITWVAPSGYGFVRFGDDHEMKDVVCSDAFYKQLYEIVPDLKKYPTTFHSAYLTKELDSVSGIVSLLWDYVSNMDDPSALYNSLIVTTGTMSTGDYSKDFFAHLVNQWNASRADDFANRKYDLSGFNSGGVLLEDAIGNIMDVAFDLSDAQTAQLKSLVEALKGKISGNVLTLGGYLNRILNWREADVYTVHGEGRWWEYTTCNFDPDKNETISGLWTFLNSASTNGATLQSILGSDYDTVKQSFPVVADFLFEFISRDYNQEYGSIYSGIPGNQRRMYLTATLVNNLLMEDGSILVPHYMGTYIAAVQAEDDFYTAPYHVTVDGRLQYMDGGNAAAAGAASVCLAGYDEAGRLVTTEMVDLTALTDGGYARLHSGKAAAWQVYFLNEGMVPVTSAPLNGSNIR